MRVLALGIVVFGIPLLAESVQPGQLAPIDWKTRAEHASGKFTSFQHVIETAPAYLMNHGLDQPNDWNQDAGGFARRVGSTYAAYGIREGIELGLFAIHKEDPRYRPMAGAPFGRRVGHILKSAFFSRNAEGREVLAVNNLIALTGARVISNAWLPNQEHGAGRVTFNIGLHLLGKAGGNAIREFWPDVRGRKH